jgi:hypothetical protein
MANTNLKGKFVFLLSKETGHPQRSSLKNLLMRSYVAQGRARHSGRAGPRTKNLNTHRAKKKTRAKKTNNKNLDTREGR